MSVDQKVLNEEPVKTADGVDAESTTVENSNKDVVAYETYRKTLSLAKKREQELDTVKSALLKATEEKLALEGKKDELLGSREKTIQELQGKLKKVVGAFGHKTLAQVVSSEASKEGCVNIGDLIALSDLSTIEMDEDFNVNVEQVKEMVTRAKKERSYLFNKPTSSAKTGVPTSGSIGANDDWKKLPLQEQLKQAFSRK